MKIFAKIVKNFSAVTIFVKSSIRKKLQVFDSFLNTPLSYIIKIFASDGSCTTGNQPVLIILQKRKGIWLWRNEVSIIDFFPKIVNS